VKSAKDASYGLVSATFRYRGR